MTMKEVADRAGVSYGYLTHAARGHQNMGVKVQARVESVLQAPAKIAPATCANRPASVVSGQSSYVRERARALGMSMRELAERVGVSASHMSMVSRGRRSMGVRVQALVVAALEAQATVASAQLACVDPQVVWERMNAHGFSQNEVARRAGISSAHLSNIMNGKTSPSAGVLRKLHGVLFRRTKSEERVMPAELKVLGWRKGERHGTVVHGAGGPGRRGRSGGPAIRVGGHVPWGAKAEFAYRAGVRRHGPGLDHPRRREGLLRHAEAAGDGCRLENRGRDTAEVAVSLPRHANVCGLFCVYGPCGLTASVVEQVAQAQRVRHLPQRQHVPGAGPHVLVPPAPHGFRMGP